MKAIRHTRRAALRSLAVLASTLLLMPTGLGQAATLLPPSITPFLQVGPTGSTANWMGNMAGTIGTTALNNLVIPGTHDSGTYGITAQSAPSPDDQSPTCASIQNDVNAKVPSAIASVVDKAIGSFCNPIVGSISAEWAKAQDLSLTYQLDGGVRYLDIRICPPESGNTQLMICHGDYSVSLASALGEIKMFAQAHPKEIILADFSPLTKSGGYTPSGDQPSYATLDSETTQQIESTLSDVLLKPSGVSLTSTMNQLWAAGGSVIALVPSGMADADLWDSGTGLINAWANVDNVDTQATDDSALLQCRCGSVSGSGGDASALFKLYLNSTPSTALIESSILDLIDQASDGALGSNIPGYGVVMTVIRNKEGWPNNPPDSLEDMATRGERIGPWLLQAAGQSATLRQNLNIIATDFVEQSSVVQMALALDAQGRIYGPESQTSATYTVPSGVHEVQIMAVGGSGSGGPNYLDPNSGPGHHGGVGGRGAIVSGVASVQPGQTLSLWVGQNGRANGFSGESLPSYPGGGCGQFIQVNPTTGGCGVSSGGAASYVATAAADSSGNPSAATLLVVAGGGGAGAAGGQQGAGGNGGDAGAPGGSGYNGTDGSGWSSCFGTCAGGHGSPGSQSQGGSQGAHQPHDSDDCRDARTAGAYLNGGYDDGNGGGGGGGGYYGGGAGGAGAAPSGSSCYLAGGGGGGGGSSYTAETLSSITSGLDPNVSSAPHPGWTDEQRGNPYIIITPLPAGTNAG